MNKEMHKEMKEYKLLTDGGYGDLDDAIGKIVKGYQNNSLVQVSVNELIRAGASEEDWKNDINDEWEYGFWIESEIEEVIK